MPARLWGLWSGCHATRRRWSCKGAGLCRGSGIAGVVERGGLEKRKPLTRGTEGSNPSPSSGESTANRISWASAPPSCVITSTNATSRRVATAVAIVAGSMLVIRLVVIEHVWRQADEIYSADLIGIDALPRGIKLAVAIPPDGIHLVRSRRCISPCWQFHGASLGADPLCLSGSAAHCTAAVLRGTCRRGAAAAFLDSLDRRRYR